MRNKKKNMKEAFNKQLESDNRYIRHYESIVPKLMKVIEKYEPLIYHISGVMIGPSIWLHEHIAIPDGFFCDCEKWKLAIQATRSTSWGSHQIIEFDSPSSYARGEL